MTKSLDGDGMSAPPEGGKKMINRISLIVACSVILGFCAIASFGIFRKMLVSSPNDTGYVVDVKGTVVDAVTSSPLRGVAVELRFAEFEIIPTGARRSRPRSLRFFAVTDEFGKFSLSEVPAGRYIWRATHDGYELPRGSERLVSISSTASDSRAVLRMARASIVEGVVVDRGQNGVSGTSLELLQIVTEGGQRSVVSVYSGFATEHGHFAFPTVLPGIYYLRGRSYSGSSTEGPVAPPRLAETFYPGVRELDAATPIQVVEGHQRTALRLQLQEADYYSLSGRVEGLRSGQRQVVRLVPLSGEKSNLEIQEPATPLKATVSADGHFYFKGVASGMYVARLAAGPTDLHGRTRFTLKHRDIDNLLISVPPAFTLSGRVTFVGGKIPPGGMQTILWEAEDGGTCRFMPVDVTETGEFKVNNVTAGLHRFSFIRKGDIVIRQVQVGRRIFDGGQFEWASGEDVVVTMSFEGAVVAGSVEEFNVKGSDDQSEHEAFVTLIGTPKNALQSETFQVAPVDLGGHFAIKSLEPGSYRICAWRGARQKAMEIEASAYWQKSLDGTCVKTSVPARGTQFVTVKAMSLSDFN